MLMPFRKLLNTIWLYNGLFNHAYGAILKSQSVVSDRSGLVYSKPSQDNSPLDLSHARWRFDAAATRRLLGRRLCKDRATHPGTETSKYCVKLTPAECHCRYPKMEKFYGKGFQFSNDYKLHLQLLNGFDRIMNKLNVPYSISTGTALGYGRHGSVVPYDNDVDVVLPGSGRKKLAKYLLNLLGISYDRRGTFKNAGSKYPRNTTKMIGGLKVAFALQKYIADVEDHFEQQNPPDFVFAFESAPVSRLASQINPTPMQNGTDGWDGKRMMTASVTLAKTAVETAKGAGNRFHRFGKLFLPSGLEGNGFYSKYRWLDLFGWDDATFKHVRYDQKDLDNDEFSFGLRRVKINDIEVSCMDDSALDRHLQKEYGPKWKNATSHQWKNNTWVHV